MILMIDNYDSFTFNLVQALEAAGAEVRVVRNDAIDRGGRRGARRRQAADLRGIVISPGPGNPETPASRSTRSRSPRPAGSRCWACASACSRWRPRTAASIVRAPTLVHGEASEVAHDGEGLLAGMPPASWPPATTRCASIRRRSPAELRVTAMSEDGVVMGLRHRSLPIEGVQFHPRAC